MAYEDLSGMTPDEQRDYMRAWFYEHYEDPVHSLPYDSAEGGYIWVEGEPCVAKDVLQEQFGKVVPKEIIEALADELDEECTDWKMIAEPLTDYDSLQVKGLLILVVPNAIPEVQVTEVGEHGNNSFVLHEAEQDEEGNATRLVFHNPKFRVIVEIMEEENKETTS